MAEFASTSEKEEYGAGMVENQTGNVLRIEKSSIYDGDGLRTVVFLKGCPLRCKWCSTPESQQAEPAFGCGRKMTVSEVMEEVENLKETALFCSDLNCVEEIELLAYHRLGTETYEKLGMNYELKDVKTPDKVFMDKCVYIIRCVCPQITVKHNKEKL